MYIFPLAFAKSTYKTAAYIIHQLTILIKNTN